MLAREVTALVHGEPAMREAEAIAAALFSGDSTKAQDLPGGAVPGAVLPAEAARWPLWRVIKEAGLVTSTAEARRLIQQGGVEVDGVRAATLEQFTPAGAHTFKLGKRRIYRLIIETPRV